MTHEHTWRPGLPPEYECDCGAIGQRNLRTGAIRAYCAESLRRHQAAEVARAAAERDPNRAPTPRYQPYERRTTARVDEVIR